MNPLGTSSQIETASGATLSNEFNTIPVNDINSIIASNSVKSTQIGSGMNGSNQQVRSSDGSYMTIGIDTDTNEMGIFFYDASGNMVMKITQSNISTFDLSQSPVVNNMQLLKLPDGTYGMVTAKTGKNVADLFS